MEQKEEVAVSVVRVSRPIVVMHYILKRIPIVRVWLAYKLLGIKLTLKLFPARMVYSDNKDDIYGNGMIICGRVFILDKPPTSKETARSD